MHWEILQKERITFSWYVSQLVLSQWTQVYGCLDVLISVVLLNHLHDVRDTIPWLLLKLWASDFESECCLMLLYPFPPELLFESKLRPSRHVIIAYSIIPSSWPCRLKILGLILPIHLKGNRLGKAINIYTPTVPEPGKILITPLGNPAFTESSPNFKAVSGVT